MNKVYHLYHLCDFDVLCIYYNTKNVQTPYEYLRVRCREKLLCTTFERVSLVYKPRESITAKKRDNTVLCMYIHTYLYTNTSVWFTQQR